MAVPPAGRVLSDRDIHGLRLRGDLPADRYLEAMALVRDAVAWRRWAGRVVLALAVGQVLAAAVFFFAFNWQALPGLVKIGGALAAAVACGGAALVVAVPLARQALVVACALLTGVTLAVLGQHYQTGADAWQLFAAWGLLILPVTVAAGGPVLWLVWALVAQTALVLADGALDLSLPLAAHAALPAVFVAAREVRPDRVARWLALVAQIALLAVLGWKAGGEITGAAMNAGTLPWGLPALTAATVASWLGPWRRRRDLASLALSVCAVCVVVSAGVFEAASGVIGMAIGTAVVGALFAGAVALLSRLRRMGTPR